MKGNLTLLMILDGFGYSEEKEGNAIALAETPNLDKFYAENPSTLIGASGMAVGLPDGQMGNSEVGHLNLGAGRIVYQSLTRITKAIEDGDFFTNKALVEGAENCKKHDSALHLMGLVSDGGVHSHNTHLYAFLEFAKRQGLKKVYVHCFMDGRDTSPTSGINFIKELEAKMQEIGVGEIASVTGRFYAMDRDNRWEREEKAYNAIVMGEGNHAKTAVEAVEASYAADLTDEFILPTVIGDKDRTVKANDSIMFFNFRPDRARQLTRTFVDPDFDEFKRQSGFLPVYFVTTTQYDANLTNLAIAFEPEEINNTLGEYLSENNIRQLRIAETEKYAHVTYFFNGGIEKVHEGEDRILVPSPHVETYDLQPEMSAPKVTEKLLEAIATDKYKVIILNYANVDMVGHTGSIPAEVKAVETIDGCAQKIIEAVQAKDGNVIITADHGNGEKMIDYDTGKIFTAHTTNPVKCGISGVGHVPLREGGVLADISPTILDLIELKQPEEMTGVSLLKK